MKFSQIKLLFMSAILLLNSCGPATIPDVSVDKSYVNVGSPILAVSSGESVFSGMFFGQGPTAKLFPEIWQDPDVVKAMSQMTAEDRANFETFRKETVQRITAQNPQFFNTFGQDIQSGNPVRVRSAIIRVQSEFKRLYPKADAEISTSKISPQCCGPTFCVLGVVVHVGGAVTSYLVVVAAVVVVGFAWKYLGVSNSAIQSTDGNSLYDDVWLANATRRLAAN